MAFGDISSRDAVIRAIEESDERGEVVFLREYGFRRARKYFLYYNERCYSSKAIMGVAHGYQFPRQGPLTSAEFSGGRNTVMRKLNNLGFEVRVGDC